MAVLAGFAYRPFISPLPIWSFWWVLVFPLTIAVSVVYKAIKLPSMKDVPREAAIIAMWILLGMATAAAFLTGVVKVLER